MKDEEADAVFSALSSSTARRIYTTLDEEPGTPSDVAEAIDSSIQNVRYHLEKLEDAGLVEVVDTWYSSRGNEMSVYAPANGPLIVTSDESTASKLKAALTRFLGGIGALAGGSLLVQYGLERFFADERVDTAETTPTDAGVPADDAADDMGDADAADEPVDEVDTAETTDVDDDEEAVLDDDDDAEFASDDIDDTDGTDDEAGISAEQPDDDGEDDADMDADQDVEDQDEGDQLEAEADDTGDVALDSEYQLNETTGESTEDNVSQYSDNGTSGESGGNLTGDPVTDGGAETADVIFATIPPGALFFLGGLVVLTAMTVYWYWSTY